jgi:hypothetical protein
MAPRSAKPLRGLAAWLVTWEHIGDHARPSERVAAVLGPRLSGRRVAEIVELLYANASYDPSERIALLKNGAPNPYPARFGSLRGASWEGEICCGHNPWLQARLVDNLRVECDPSGAEQFVWDERRRPGRPSPGENQKGRGAS